MPSLWLFGVACRAAAGMGYGRFTLGLSWI